jgi:hypothetical protein
MSSKRKVESVMGAAADVRAIFPRHAPKLLARLLGIPVGTAHEWIYRRMPEARRNEVALVLLAECDRLEMMIADTRRRWEGVANAPDGSVARGKAAVARPEADRVGK